MFFKDVIGQEEVKRRLLCSVDNDHVAHAQLLCGPEGVGKFAMAMAYARYMGMLAVYVRLAGNIRL